MNAASLLVKIGCDVEDFTRGMTKAEKAAKRGFDEIGEAAKKMTELFTIEVAATALEFAHLAAEAQDASARMDRVFGGASAEMKQKLEELTHSIPATVAELQNLAVQSDNMLQGLGYGADKAASMSVEMVKLAGDMAAFAHVPIADALEALDRGLAGKTRGLVQFGIVVSQQQIHLEAMRRGLVDNHRTLTELGTAEIAESLIRQAATRITGEAERTAGQASNSFKFLKASAEEAGVSIGSILLPPLVSLVGAFKTVTEAIERSSEGAKKVVLWAVGITAAIGPAILITVRFAKELIALRRAMELFSAGEGIAAVIGGIAAAPVAVVVGALVAITAAAAGVYAIWRKFKGQDSTSALNNDPALNAAIAAQQKGPKTKDGALWQDARSPLDKFRSSQSQANGLFDNALATGNDLPAMYQRLAGARAQAFNAMHNEGKRDIDFFLAAADAYEKARQKIAAFDLGKDIKNGSIRPGEIRAESVRRMSDGAVQSKLADSLVSNEDSMRMRQAALEAKDLFDAPREASVQMGEQMRTTKHDLDVRSVMLTLKDGFDAAKVAAVDFGERLRKTSNDFATALASLKTQWSSGGNVMSSALAGLQQGAASVMDAFSPMALAAQAIGAIMQGLQPVLNALFVPLIELGRIIGIILIPTMRPLFEALKVFGIAVALIGEVVYTVAGGIAKALGALISGIGRIISKIPFMGGLGHDVQDFGSSISNLGASFFKTADELDTARRQLQDMSFEDAMNGVTAAANATASAMLNVPTGVKGFNAALEQFNALTPKGPISPNGPANFVVTQSTAASDDNRPLVLVLDGKVLTQTTLKQLRKASQAQFGDSTQWSQVMALA